MKSYQGTDSIMNAVSWLSIGPFIDSGVRLEQEQFGTALDAVRRWAGRCGGMDPFLVDLSEAPALAQVKEERYSGHLYWLFKKVDWNTSWPFELLKVPVIPAGRSTGGIQPTIRREVPVEEGHKGQGGRLDVLILFDTALIDIEVKVVVAESADLKKNEGYRASLERRYPKPEYAHFHRLLVTDARKPQYNEGSGGDEEAYIVIRWEEVCIGIRRSICKGAFADNPMMVSLFLFFVGGVEQVLLGYKHLDDSKGWIDHETFQYILRVENGSRKLEGKMDDLTEQFFREGIPSYVKALKVIDRYEGIIQEIAKSVLSKKLNTISDAMGAGSLGPITPYVPKREELSKGLSSGYAGTGVYTDVPECGRCYVTAYVYDDKKKKMSADVSFDLGNAGQALEIIKAAKAMPGMESILNDDSSEDVYVEELLSEVSTKALAKAMESLLDKWISFWREVGGIQKLFSKK